MLEFYMDTNDNSKSVNLTLSTMHQRLPFNAVYCGEFHTGDKYFTKRDGLNNYLILVTVDGRGELSWHGRSCFLEKGSAVLIDCNTFHEYKTSSGKEWHFYFLHFNAVSMSGYNNLLLKSLTPVILRCPDVVYNLMKELNTISLFSDTKTYFIISNIISQLLTEMICSVSEEDEAMLQSGREDIRKLQEYIESNFEKELCIDDFMRCTNLSRHYLIHLFKEQTGISPYRYMHMCRIIHSQKLLITTDLSLTQIAESTGYGSVAVFIRHFKAFNNITPNKYRQEFYCYGIRKENN